MKKAAPAFAVFLVLFACFFHSTQLFHPVQANPSPKPQFDPPNVNLPPPVISVQFPENGSLFNTSFVSFAFNVTIPDSNISSDKPVWWTYYMSDWNMKNWNPTGSFLIFQQYATSEGNLNFKNLSVNLTDIPEGKHSVIIYAERVLEINHVMLTASSEVLVNFVIDYSAPHVLSLSVENKTYKSPELPLSFVVDEAVSEASYSLDNQARTVINGNTTLAGLSGGRHTLTVYVVDFAGNVGSSETVSFFVDAPFPTTSVALLVAAVSVVGASVVAVAAVVYWKKRKR